MSCYLLASELYRMKKKKTTSEKSPRGQTEVYPCGPTSLRSVNTNGTITTILFFYWIGAVSQCALSLCNIIYDARRPKNYSLYGSTWKCKTFATRTWKFVGTVLRRSLISEIKIGRKEPCTVYRQYSKKNLTDI